MGELFFAGPAYRHVHRRSVLRATGKTGQRAAGVLVVGHQAGTKPVGVRRTAAAAADRRAGGGDVHLGYRYVICGDHRRLDRVSARCRWRARQRAGPGSATASLCDVRRPATDGVGSERSAGRPVGRRSHVCVGEGQSRTSGSGVAIESRGDHHFQDGGGTLLHPARALCRLRNVAVG